MCENNGWAEFTPLSSHTLVERLADHANTYLMANVTVDGNDVLAVKHAMSEAVERARASGGPTLVEALTYRHGGHYIGDPARYREAAQVVEWKARDPVLRFQRYLGTQKGVGVEAVQQAEARARAAVEEAASYALDSPLPSPEDLETDLYA